MAAEYRRKMLCGIVEEEDAMDTKFLVGKLVRTFLLTDNTVKRRVQILFRRRAQEWSRHGCVLRKIDAEMIALQARCSHNETRKCYGQDLPSYDLCLVCGACLE